MARTARISEAEWEVMSTLWERAPQTGNEVVETLSGSRSWHPRTVKTLLGRLVRKGALTFVRQGREYLYEPAVSRESCVRAEARSFAERIFGGNVQPLLAHFLEDAKLSNDEVAELRRLLDEQGGRDEHDDDDRLR